MILTTRLKTKENIHKCPICSTKVDDERWCGNKKVCHPCYLLIWKGNDIRKRKRTSIKNIRIYDKKTGKFIRQVNSRKELYSFLECDPSAVTNFINGKRQSIKGCVIDFEYNWIRYPGELKNKEENR